MKTIMKREYNWHFGKDVVRYRYESIDRTLFNSKEKCLQHEENIRRYMDFYELCLRRNIYSRARLAEIYNDYQVVEDEWWRAGGNDWLNYCAGQYALKEVLAQH